MHENQDDPLNHKKFFARCPKCGAEAKLLRNEKFPQFGGEVRVYECGICHHKAEVIVRDNQDGGGAKPPPGAP
jgi:phage terminase large subunit GpA-like protein